MLADRQIQVKRPRLRHKRNGEVAVPAYDSLQENGAAAERMMGALLRGVSTRQYEEVLPEIAGTVGVSRSNISPPSDRRQLRAITATARAPLGTGQLLASMVSALELTM